MKKIVGILSAAALAASMFAVDFSANLKQSAKLFNYASETATIIGAPGLVSLTYDAPTMSFSVSSDNAGGSFKIATEDTKIGDFKIWFKPLDIVQVEVGSVDGFALNTETIGYSNVLSGSGSYAVSVNTNGFMVGLNLAGDLITIAKDVDPVVNQVYAKVAYSADFGTIGAAAKFEETFKKMTIGAGYAGNVSGISFFADAVLDAGDVNAFDKANLLVDAFAKQQIDALGWNVYSKVKVPFADGVDVEVLAKARLTYNIDALTVSLDVSDNNILAKDFDMTIKPMVAGSLGCMGWNVAVEVKAKKDFEVAVPVNFSVAF